MAGEMREVANRWAFPLGFAAIMATSFCFILRALVIDEWGVVFALSETQKGQLLGAGLWPFAITIVLLSLIVDKVGFRAIFAFAGFAHLAGLALLLSAHGYVLLYAGTFVMALGNGAVEAAANPLIATVHASDKPRWLNRLHAAWPGGMIAGGLLAIALGQFVGWQVKVALMVLPVLAYLALLSGARLPVSERVASGVSFRAMLQEAGWGSAFIILFLIMLEVGRLASLGMPAILVAAAALTLAFGLYVRRAGKPLYILFVLLMLPLAITELSTDSWISSLMAPEMARLGLQPGWVLIYASFIVFLIRIVAGSVIARLTPLGTLALASFLTAIALFLLSGQQGYALLCAATLYGIGKSFFWGTSLAVVSERFPRAGAVGINVVAGAGMLAAGIVGSALLGAVQDRTTVQLLAAQDGAQSTSLVERYTVVRSGNLGGGTYRTIDEAALARAPAQERVKVETARDLSRKDALSGIALLPLLMALVYALLVVWFRQKGGYKPVVLTDG